MNVALFGIYSMLRAAEEIAEKFPVGVLEFNGFLDVLRRADFDAGRENIFASGASRLRQSHSLKESANENAAHPDPIPLEDIIAESYPGGWQWHLAA